MEGRLLGHNIILRLPPIQHKRSHITIGYWGMDFESYALPSRALRRKMLL